MLFGMNQTKEMETTNTVDDLVSNEERQQRSKERLKQLTQTLQQKMEHVIQCRAFYDRIIQVLKSDKINTNLLCHFHVQTRNFDEILQKRYTSLASGEIRVMVIGESTAGKSTFLNVLMQGNYLPIGDHEAGTGIVCELHNCPSRRAVIHYKERFKMRPKKLKLTNNRDDKFWKRLRKCIRTGRDGNTDSPMGVLKVEIYWPLLFFQATTGDVECETAGNDQVNETIAKEIVKEISDKQEEATTSSVKCDPAENDQGADDTSAKKKVEKITEKRVEATTTSDVECEQVETDQGTRETFAMKTMGKITEKRVKTTTNDVECDTDVDVQDEDTSAEKIVEKIPEKRVELTSKIKLVFVDSPGFDDDRADPSEAEGIAKSSDLYLFVINNGTNHGVAQDRVLKRMNILAELVQTEESIFDPDCTFFFCNKWDMVPSRKAASLKKDILQRLQTAWPRISSHHLFPCSFAQVLNDASNKAISEKYLEFLDHSCRIVEHAVYLKLEKHFRWLIHFLETCTAVIANRNAMQGFDKQQREKVREYIIKLNGDLRNFQDECQSKRKELASKKTKAIKDMKSNLKWCLESIRKKPFQWLADDIPTRRQDEPWSGYNESLKRTIVKRIDVAIMNDDGVKDICAKYQESHKDMLEKLSTKFKHLESHMSLHGPSRAIDGYDQQNLPFLYKLLGPFRKLFTLLKDILETNHILDTCYSEEEFSSDRNRYMKTQTENVLRFYAQEMQLQSTATAIVENMWDSVEKTISCFVACMHFRDKCLAEIFDSELDKRSLEYWRKEFFQPEVDKCSKVFISMVMKHDIDQSRLKIDNDIIAQCGYALVKKGNLTEGDREVEIAAKIVRRPASECEIDIFRECFLLRQLTLKAEASDGNVFPHLVKFYGSSYVEKGEIMELHLIMELCHTDLGERIKENYLLSFNSRKHNIPFPGRKALDKKQPCRESVFHAIDITRQAASGLEFIHKNGIIHRDVKANNFLMNQREDEIVIKIADFGVSRCNDVATTKSKSVGTQPYHAPEFYTRFFTTHTFSSDVYSFGLLLWEVWHGERVFDRVSSESDFLHPDTISKYLHWKDDHETRYSSDLQVLMKKCCNQKPKKRPEMKYVMDQLTRFAEKNKEIS